MYDHVSFSLPSHFFDRFAGLVSQRERHVRHKCRIGCYTDHCPTTTNATNVLLSFIILVFSFPPHIVYGVDSRQRCKCLSTIIDDRSFEVVLVPTGVYKLVACNNNNNNNRTALLLLSHHQSDPPQNNLHLKYYSYFKKVLLI
jgi:hypothetical protein